MSDTTHIGIQLSGSCPREVSQAILKVLEDNGVPMIDWCVWLRDEADWQAHATIWPEPEHELQQMIEFIRKSYA